MEHSFRLSSLFPDKISVIGSDLIPVGCPMVKEVGEIVVRERTIAVLDGMGLASAQAQLLPSVITSADRLCDGDCKVYLYCDFISNKVVGFLKIGKKKLILYDSSNMEREIKPMCILDFHIFDCWLRHGAGTYLFDFMLRKEMIPVEHFAFDSPSDKFINFLKKHYNLTKIFPQANNFYIPAGFFQKRGDNSENNDPWHEFDRTPKTFEKAVIPEIQELRMENYCRDNVQNAAQPNAVCKFGGSLQSFQQQQDSMDMVNEQFRCVSIGDAPQQNNNNEGQERNFFFNSMQSRSQHHGNWGEITYPASYPQSLW